MIMAVAAMVLTSLVHSWPHITALFSRDRQQQLSQPPAAAPQSPSNKSEPQSDSGQSSLFQNALLMGAILGVIGWSGKMILSFVSRRSEMVVMHVLSDGTPREYAVLLKEVETHELYRENLFVRGSIKDAIAHLVSLERIMIDNGKYARMKPKEDNKNS